MRTRLILATLFIAVAIANYLPFTQSAYWSNAGTFFNQNTTYLIGQTNSPDNSSDYQLTSSTLPTCVVGGPWYEQYWEMDYHLLRATSDYHFTLGSAYDVIYDSNRCGLNGLPRLYVYKVQNGASTLLLNVQLAGDQAGQQFTTFIRNDGPR